MTPTSRSPPTAARIFTEDELDLTGGSSLATLVNVMRADLALENGLRTAGLSPEQAAEVRATPPPDVEALAADPADEVDPSRVGTALVINILLFLMLQTYGGWVLTAVTREKASRVVEVLLAVITPRQLLIGKVVGIGVVALIHASALIATAFVATRVMGVDLTSGIKPGDLAIALIWFGLGYALYCGAFAAAGSLVSRTEDAQGAAFPIMLPILFAYIVSFSAADGANTLLWVLAFIPFTAVVAMPTLYAIGEAPLWAVGLSMLITLAAIVAVGLLAAKIYERSVLHSRKLSWRDAFRQRREIDTPTSIAAADSARHLGERAPAGADDPCQARAGGDRWRAREQLAEQVAVDVAARGHQQAGAAAPDDRCPVPVEGAQRVRSRGRDDEHAGPALGDQPGELTVWVVDAFGVVDDDECRRTCGQRRNVRRCARPRRQR